MFEYPQNFLEDKQDPTDNSSNLEVLHGPFSPLHIESRKTENSKIVTINSDTERTFFIPKTEEVGREKLLGDIKSNLQGKEPIVRDRIVNSLGTIMRAENNSTYGEYLPATYTSNTSQITGVKEENMDGKSINPALFITNFLLKESVSIQEKKEIVLHPDIIYFLSQGQKDLVKPSIEFLNQIAQSLNLKLFFENLQFSNPKMRTVFDMYVDPMQLLNELGEKRNLGIAMDLKHLQKHYTSEQLQNIVLSVIGNTDRNRILIHSREGLELEFPDIYKKCVSNGIPWVVEQESK